MAERPILFSGEMVLAILDGRKTMTRRVVKPQPEPDTDCPHHVGTGIERKARICPYGKPGDRLWVRETFCSFPDGNIFYRADNDERAPMKGWKPSIFMPRALSRITLEIKNVRVERLQDISENDAKAEGTDGERYLGQGFDHCVYREAFRTLWESINGPGSWESNPWVWVVEFKQITEASK